MVGLEVCGSGWVERAEFNGQPFGFVEARTKFHKTATSLAKKQRHMPVVEPLLGVTHVDWSRYWLAAMKELNIDVDHEPLVQFAEHQRMMAAYAADLALWRRLVILQTNF